MVMAAGRVFHLFCLFYCATLEYRKEQRVTIKACVSWGFDSARTYNAVTAVWGDHTLSRTQVRHWFKVLSQDPARSTSDKKRSGQPKTAFSEAGIDAVEQALHAER